MNQTGWPPAEIHAIASVAGKSLEVACAQKFLAASWKPRLESYFEDASAGKPRELDVLVEKDAPAGASRGPIRRVRALLSCKGFKPEHAPLVYSVSTGSVDALGYSPRPRMMQRFVRQVSPPGRGCRNLVGSGAGLRAASKRAPARRRACAPVRQA
jgi:hypothetical protein